MRQYDIFGNLEEAKQDNNMNKSDQLEYTIFIALFKATIEQTAQLNGTTKQQTKVIFKGFQKNGLRLLDKIESVADIDRLEDITGVIEDIIHELRRELSDLNKK